MAWKNGLQHGPLTARCAHLCVDMQNLFGPGSEWETPWMQRVLPLVMQLAGAFPERTVFTRFIPARRPQEAPGTWREYYERWSGMTQDALPTGMLDLLEPLQRFVPPATVVDKMVYSPWLHPALDDHLYSRGIDTLVISGAETDVCVLAAVLGAVDRGYRVIIPTDAICSGSDRTHDALLTLYNERFSQQIETATTDEILRAWH